MLKPKYGTISEAVGDFRTLIQALDVRMPKDNIPLSEEQEDALVEQVLNDAWKPAASGEMYGRAEKLKSVAQKRTDALQAYKEKFPHVRIDKPLHTVNTPTRVAGAHKDHQHRLYTMHAKAAAAHSALARHAGEASKHFSGRDDDQSSNAYHDMASRASEKAKFHQRMIAGHSDHMKKIGNFSRKNAAILHKGGVKSPTMTGRSKPLYAKQPAQASEPVAPAAPPKRVARSESLEEFRMLAGLTERQPMPFDPGMSGLTKWNDDLLSQAKTAAIPLVERVEVPQARPTVARHANVMGADPVKASRDAMHKSWFARHHKGGEGALSHGQLAPVHMDLSNHLKDMANKAASSQDPVHGPRRRKAAVKLTHLSRMHREIGQMHSQNRHHPMFESMLSEDQVDEFVMPMLTAVGRGLAGAARGVAKVGTSAAQGAAKLGASAGRAIGKGASALGRGIKSGVRTVGNEFATGVKDAAQTMSAPSAPSPPPRFSAPSSQMNAPKPEQPEPQEPEQPEQPKPQQPQPQQQSAIRLKPKGPGAWSKGFKFGRSLVGESQKKQPLRLRRRS